MHDNSYADSLSISVHNVFFPDCSEFHLSWIGNFKDPGRLIHDHSVKKVSYTTGIPECWIILKIPAISPFAGM